MCWPRKSGISSVVFGKYIDRKVKVIGRMPNFKSARRSMRQRLGWYMVALAALLIGAVYIGLASVGRLSSPGREMERTLRTQMAFLRMICARCGRMWPPLPCIFPGI